MVLGMLRQVLIALTICAFVGGMTMQATPSAAALGPEGGSKPIAGCRHMAMHDQGPGEAEPMPTRGMDADCVKQMGCIGLPNLPSRSAQLQMTISYSTVVYWSPVEKRAGLSIAPDLLPPRAS